MNILAIGAHPDDVEIGCGGTLKKHRERGHQIFLLVISDGSAGGKPDVRQAEQHEAAQRLGAKDVIWGGLTDTEVSHDRNTILLIEKAIEESQCEMIFPPSEYDTHQDHQNVCKSTLSAARHVDSILYYQTPSTTDAFRPKIFVDISDAYEQKLQALKAHASQMGRLNQTGVSILDRVESWAIYWGRKRNRKYAEGFDLERLNLGIFLELDRPQPAIYHPISINMDGRGPMRPLGSRGGGDDQKVRAVLEAWLRRHDGNLLPVTIGTADGGPTQCGQDLLPVNFARGPGGYLTIRPVHPERLAPIDVDPDIVYQLSEGTEVLLE